MVFSAGSVKDYVYSGISPFPLAISGILPTLVNNSIFFVEQMTGDSLGTTSIADRYQPAITHLAQSNVLKLMAVQDMGVQSVSIGDLTTDNSNLMELAKQFEEMGKTELLSLTRGIKFFKSRG